VFSDTTWVGETDRQEQERLHINIDMEGYRRKPGKSKTAKQRNENK
jgi:hypothetical protein